MNMSMNEIYVLIIGEYSDWQIEGFVESEEEALKNCAVFNESHDNGGNMYYEAVSKFEDFSAETLGRIKRKYDYTVRAWRNEEGWQFQEVNQIDIEMAKEWMDEKHEVSIHTPDMFCNWAPYATIKLTLATVDREKALKIAQDMLYKKLAEKEGL